MTKQEFTSSEEFFIALKKHGGYIKNGVKVASVLFANDRGVVFYNDYDITCGLHQHLVFYHQFLQLDWTFLDGTPIYREI